MTWNRIPARWRDGESRSALVLLAAGVLAALVNCLPPELAPRCMLKTLTGMPCLTCGASRALHALRAGRIGEAVRLQPLVTGGVFVAVVWVIYAWSGPLFRASRFRPRDATPRELALLIAVLAAAALGNWAYLFADGR